MLRSYFTQIGFIRVHQLILAGLITLLSACDIETSAPSQPLNDDALDAAEQADGTAKDAASAPIEARFIQEPYGLGADWYHYDEATHALTPRAQIYRMDLDSRSATLFKIESYYDERGSSGHFQLALRAVDLHTGELHGSGEDALVLGSNIKDGPVCVSLADAREVPCEAGEHNLVFRISAHPIAEAGFAVADPAIFSAAHWSDPAPAPLLAGSFTTLKSAAEAVSAEALASPGTNPAAWRALPDVLLTPEAGALSTFVERLAPGESSAALLQATANMQLVGWTFTRLDEENSFEFAADCAPLSTTRKAQTRPRTAKASPRTLSFQPGRLTLVNLCGASGPEIVHTASTPYRALWPDTYDFNLVVDTLGERAQFRLAPGQPIWSSGADKIDDSTEIPADLWSD